MKQVLLSFLVFALGPGLLSAQAPADSLFSRATDAYNEGEYQKAIDLYESILEEDLHSSALYFNLGNAHYKLGRIAPSIYYYEKAMLLDPNDAEIRNNLGFAQNMTLDDIEPMPRTDLRRAYDAVLHMLPMDRWAYLGIALMFLFVVGSLFYYLLDQPNKKRISLIGALAALLLAMTFTSFAFLNYREYQRDQPAIIFSESLPVRAEPNPRSEAVFELHEGTKVQVLDSLDSWIRLRIADGQTGWAQGDALRLLKDF